MYSFILREMLIIIDLDGVVYRGKKVILQAPNTISRLRERGHGIYFLTNNSALTREGFKQRLSHHGIKCSKEEIMSSGYATTLFLKEKRIRKDIFVIGGEGLVREIKKAGFNVVRRNTHKIGCVVVGMDRHFKYHDLCIAQEAILKGAAFVATNADPTYPVEKGILPGAGTLVSAIKTASSTPPIIIGKPNPYILKEILKITGIPPAGAILIGDRMSTDIVIGKKCGAKTVLVLTGVTKLSEVKKVRKNEKPDYIIKNISGLLKMKCL
jgi:phosphoglycolate/pyridoxal phosphate phosphatase family enzyme